jgi:hypothetical protein
MEPVGNRKFWGRGRMALELCFQKKEKKYLEILEKYKHKFYM